MGGPINSLPACVPDDVTAWLCFLLGMGVATLVFLLLHHVFKR